MDSDAMKNDMPGFVRRHPGLSLCVLAMAFGGVLIAPVAAGVAPPGLSQLAALSASAAGFVLAAIEGGARAVRELFARVLIWRVGLGWWCFALLFPIIPAAATLEVAAAFGKHTVDWTGLGSLYNLIPTLVLLVGFAGLGEEFGWRGFAVPRLRSRHNALITSLIVGAFHSLWHLPLFFVKGELYHTLGLQIGFVPAFLGYSVLVTALAVQQTWIFTNTKGSVLLAAVYHGASNGWNDYIDIYRGQIAGLVAYVAVTVVVSVAVVLVYGPKTLARRSADGDAQSEKSCEETGPRRLLNAANVTGAKARDRSRSGRIQRPPTDAGKGETSEARGLDNE